MSNIRLSRSLCAVVNDFVNGSHATLDALYKSSGAPGEPPNLSHGSKWKEWLFRAGQDESVDSLAVLGNVLEEFMDVIPADADSRVEWETERQRVVDALEASGLRYFQGGRVLPNGKNPEKFEAPISLQTANPSKPKVVEELLEVLIKGLRRAMHPLTHRRKHLHSLSFSSEYDIQDLLHALLRPWIADIRPEEFTPSYAGSSTRMDFLLPAHSLVIETKLVRDKAHSKRIGDELIIDMDHYRAHPECADLWCVVYDPDCYIQNTDGLRNDLEGESHNAKGKLCTRLFII